MVVDPKRLIDRSIADLRQISSLLAAEVRGDPSLCSPELRACEGAVATIDGSESLLVAAHALHYSNPSASSCPQCEDLYATRERLSQLR